MLWQLNRQWHSLSNSLEPLSEDDKLKIAQLYVDPKYKALVKLVKQIQVDFSIKVLRDCESMDDLRGRQWASRCLQLLLNQVQENHKTQIGHQIKVDPDKMQDLPDETPIEL